MPPQWPWSRKGSVSASGSASATGSTTASASTPAETFPAGIKLMHAGKDNVVDIIFIHGLTGDRERTWTARNAPLPWIKTLLPAQIPNARILTFGYDAYVANWRGVVSKNRVGNHAMNLITAVAMYRENDDTNTRPIIFVCHSLGGLVCKDALIASRQRPERHLQNVFLSTRGVAFLGTPHSGAGLAEWGGKLARSIGLLKQTNAQIVAVLETDSEVLARIQDNFHTMIRSREQHGLSPIWITCFYEELPIAGIGVIVPYESAVLPGYIPIGIHKHHREMTKFERDDDPGFLAVVGELRLWIKNLADSTGTHVPTTVYVPESPQVKLEEKEVRIAQEAAPSFRSSLIGTVDSATTQIVQQTFYSNVNRRSVGHFVARQDVQEELTRWLLGDPSPSPTVLYGIGGSGKTQLAIQCCREAEESGFLATLWVDASSPMSVEQSYTIIAKAIQKDFSDEDDIQTTISLVHNTLRSWPERWLMVFDNYDNPKAFQTRSVREYIPESRNGYIIFTSRHTGLEHLGGNQISVSSMTKTESLDLLLRRPPSSPKEEAEGLEVVDLLGHLALALDQAGAYIRARKLPLKEFKSHYEKRKDIVFREVPDDWEYRNQSGPLSVFTTWEMSFGMITGDEDSVAWKNDFLTLAGFFDPKRISERYFRAYCDAEKVEWMSLLRVDGEWDSYELGDVLAELHKLSLIQLPDQELGERSFTIHPIVCDWLVHRRGKAKRRQMTIELINALAAFLKSSEERDLPLEINQETTLHLDCCRRHETALSGTLYETGLATLPKTASLFARFYRRQGRYSEAERLFKQTLAENERVLGPQHPDTLETVENLAIISRKQGNYNVAERLFKRALTGREKRSGRVPGKAVPKADSAGGDGQRSDQLDILRTIQNLGNVYSDQGRYDDAENLFEQALTGMQESLGPQHLETLGTAQNLANVYRKRGRYEDAAVLYQSAQEVKETKLGPEHLDTLGTAENLANVYRKQRRYAEAEEIFERSVKSKEKKLGSDHPETLRAVQNLANVYSDQEKYDKAEILYQRALRGNEKLLGLEHPDTIRTVENLGILYSKASSKDSKLRNFNLAQHLLQRALEGNKKKRGNDHPDTLGTMESLAIAHYRNREFDKAEELLRHALSGKEKMLGKQHPETLGTAKNLGNVCYKLGRFDEAEIEYRRVLDGKERLEKAEILGTMQNLANIYRKQWRPEEAEEQMLLLKTSALEVQSDKVKDTPSESDATVARKQFDFPKNSTPPLPKGRLSVSISKGRKLRPSGHPSVVCQFQGATCVSGGPKLDDETDEIDGSDGKGEGLSGGKGREGTSLARPIATPRSYRQSGSSGSRSFRAAPKPVKWIVNPKWEWNIAFDVFNDDAELEVQIYDLLDRDNTFLGLARLDVQLAPFVEPFGKWYSLGPRSDEKDSNPTGEIYLRLQFEKTERKICGPEDFQILQLIGKGARGLVFQVRKKDTDCIYAMKVWSKKTVRTIPPYIPSLLFTADAKFSFQNQTDYYVVTDFLCGGELFYHLEKEGRFNIERVRFYVAELVLALQHLHDHGIIYQDLRPENILLDATGHLVLCNFGGPEVHQTEPTDHFCGTTEYLAPEVILNENEYSKMGDFWSLGVLMFEMACGWSPFYAEDKQQMYKNIAFGKLRFPRDTLSTEARDFIKGLLNRDPSHRLGADGGAEELKRHPFLIDIDWDALAKKQVTPPFNPLVKSTTASDTSDWRSALGTSHHEISLNARAAALAAGPTSTPLTLGMQAGFKGFTFVDEGNLGGYSQWSGPIQEERDDASDWEDRFQNTEASMFSDAFEM